MDFAEIVRLTIVVVITAPGGGLLVVWLKHRADKRAADREDQAQPMILSKGVAELTDLLTQTARRSVEQAQADLAAARVETRDARDELRTAREEITRHQTLIERLTRRVQQLVDLLTQHKIPVPDED